VSIYANMYRLRMRDCLRADFPTVESLAGARRFAALADGYVARHPSRSFTIHALGARFADYLARQAPRLSRRALLADVARVEWAMQEAFEARRSAVLEPRTLAALPPRSWGRLRLPLVPSARLLTLGHAVNELITALREGRKPPRLRRRRSHVLVWRRDHVVWRADLDPLQHEVLSALAAGRTLERALARAARVFEGDAEDLRARVQASFSAWVGDGIFAALGPAPAAR
jgi:hypothetical protein